MITPIPTTITECPICGEQLQLTEVHQVWFNLTHATVTDGLIERNTDEAGEIWYGEGTTEVTIYCANDHTAEEMAAALKEQIS
jgi:hypothetical protein